MDGLVFYRKPSPEYAISFDTREATNPFRFTFGRLGGSIVKKIYLHNDNPNVYFTSLQVYFEDKSAGSDYQTNCMWSWKLIQSAYEPVPEEWEQTSDKNTISVGDIGLSSKADIQTYVPIWIRFAVPAGLLAQNMTQLVLKVTGDKNLVV